MAACWQHRCEHAMQFEIRQRQRCQHLKDELHDMNALLDAMQESKRQKQEQLIHRLHVYNDLKDATQTLFGVLANFDGLTLKEVHQRFGLQEDD
jgi:hypothetical protein